MRSNKFSFAFGIAAVIVLALATSAPAAIIFVVDAPNSDTPVRGSYSTAPYAAGAVSQTFDLSTGGDSAAGLSGNLVANVDYYWYETGSINQNMNDDYMGEMNGAGNTATWTAGGYTPGANVDVYATWRQQGNFSSNAPYVINGGTPTNIDHRVAPTADLVLADPAGGTEGFQLLGTGSADGSGQVQVVLTRGTTWTPVDAIAFSGGTTGGAPPAEATILKPVSVSTSIPGDAGSSHLYLLDDNAGYAAAGLQRPVGTGVTLETGDPLSDALATLAELSGTGHAESWTRPIGVGLPEFVFDLTGGGDTPVESILLWQYGNNGGGPNRVGNHTKDFRVILHTEAEGSTFDFGTETADLDDLMDVIEQATTEYNVAQLFDFASVQNARYAAFRIDDNYGGEPGIIAGGDRYGLGEVRFVAPAAGAIVPEPSTFVLAALGLLGLLGVGWHGRRRRKR